MMDAWFLPETARQFAYLSLLSLMALMSVWIKQGRHKGIVLGSFYASLGLGVALIIASLIAWNADQPRHVFGSLALTGIVLTIVFASILPIVYKGYAEADQRRMLAKDI